MVYLLVFVEFFEICLVFLLFGFVVLCCCVYVGGGCE